MQKKTFMFISDLEWKLSFFFPENVHLKVPEKILHNCEINLTKWQVYVVENLLPSIRTYVIMSYYI